MKRESLYALGFVGYSIVAFLISSFVCAQVFHYLIKPRKIEKSHLPYSFEVVGISPSGQAKLVPVKEYSARCQEGSWPPAYWESLKSYTYFIEPSKVEAVEKALNANLSELEHNYITLLKVDLANRVETIHLQKWSDDYDWYYVYEVRNEQVTPIAYSAKTRVMSFRCSMLFFWLFALLEVIGLVAYVVIKRRRRRLVSVEGHAEAGHGLDDRPRRAYLGAIAGILFLVAFAKPVLFMPITAVVACLGMSVRSFVDLLWHYIPWAALILGLLGVLFDGRKRVAILATIGATVFLVARYFLLTSYLRMINGQ